MGRAPEVLLLAPPPIGDVRGTDLAELFKGAQEKSQSFSHEFQCVAQELGCEFMDARDIVAPNDLDAIHWLAEDHHNLGKAVAVRVQEIIGPLE